MIATRRIGVAAEDLLRYQSLFDATFGPQQKFRPDALRWLYAENPCGLVLGFDAYDGDNLAAHYACIPVEMVYEGRIQRALLSLNTATHPAYQGKGLFVRLAEETYRAAADAGYSFVYGVANANSTPGFVRKLGFELVAPLNARICLGPLNHDVIGIRTAAQVSRHWREDTITWRMANPANPLRSRALGERLIVLGDAKGRCLPVQAEIPRLDISSDHGVGWESPIRLFLGLVPDGYDRRGVSIDIPRRFRPSPLNYIYRPLAGNVSTIASGGVAVSFVDFDPY